MSPIALCDRSKCRASTRTPAFACATCSTIRLAVPRSGTDVHGMNSRSAVNPYGAAASQNPAKRSANRSRSGSYAATRTCFARRRAPASKNAEKRCDLRFRPDRDHFQVRNRHAGRIQPRDGFPQGRRILHQRIGDASGRRGQKPESDVIVTAGRGDVDQFGWRKFERGKRGKGERRHHSTLRCGIERVRHGDIGKRDRRSERDPRPGVGSAHDRLHVVSAGVKADNGLIAGIENAGRVIRYEARRRADIGRIKPQRVKWRRRDAAEVGIGPAR